MSKQNIYDNEQFFEYFQSVRSTEINFNDCLETPILLAMLPELAGKRVLDIGCGMGHHAKHYSEMGAESVLGIDISEKMLEFARNNHGAKNITYRQMALEDIGELDEMFDVITSSLVFDYAEDLDKLMKDVNGIMKDGASLVFSMSHPMVTAYDGRYPKFTCSDSGERIYVNIRNYSVEGKRTINRIVDQYELYHRTFSSILNSLINAGFMIEECQEAYASEELMSKYPEKFGGTVHRPEFLFFRCRKASCL